MKIKIIRNCSISKKHLCIPRELKPFWKLTPLGHFAISQNEKHIFPEQLNNHLFRQETSFFKKIAKPKRKAFANIYWNIAK